MTIELFAVLLALGALVGVLAGLLGIGGGLVIVPSLLYLLPWAGFPFDVSMNVALGTSLASIIVTSGSSALNHAKLGNVEPYAIKWMMPGIVVGGFAGAYIAEWIPSEYLPKVFGVIVLLLSIQMLFSIKSTNQKSMPSPTGTVGWGTGIGVVSSLAGIGGGSLSVPFLNRHGVEMRKAVGSSSVCGSVLAFSGMIGFILNGYHAEGMPDYTVGYVYLPALLAIAMTSMLTTKVGARLASSLPTPSLKKIFALFLMVVAGTMLL